jgi:hypothetical protein
MSAPSAVTSHKLWMMESTRFAGDSLNAETAKFVLTISHFHLKPKLIFFNQKYYFFLCV